MPVVEEWPRGGAKSTTAELGVAYIGSRPKLKRRYVLYISETQDQADKHVQAIATLFEKLGIDRSLNKFGHSRGWRRNQLRTANGFNVEALGLDTAARGIKLDEFRPDVMVFDDIDNRNDTPVKTAKKITTITDSILGSEGDDAAILFIQNRIIEDGIFAQLARGTAEFLYNRECYTEPAVIDLKVEPYVNSQGRTLYRVVGGVPTWEGQSLDICEKQINKRGLPSFLRESQHEVESADGYFFDVAWWKPETRQEHRRIIESHDGTGLALARAWDFAATQDGGDYTVGSLHGWDASAEVEYVLDVVRGQLSSERVRKLLRHTAEADVEKYGSLTYVIPNDPGQAGTDQSEQLAKMLKEIPGITVVIKAPTGRKAVRARGWADQVNSGNAYLVEGEWNYHYREEHRKFREDEQHEFDDQVDTGADAHNHLTGGITIQWEAW